jgi:CDGSH-type Zn-finger protein
MTPLKFSPEDDGVAFLCLCKHSKNLPYCDGSHKAFADDSVGKAAD